MRRRREKPVTLIADLYAHIVTLERLTMGPLPDTEMNDRVAELFVATASMAHAAAADTADLELKFRVLCRRLGEFLDPDDRGGVLTYLLAASIRDDLGLLSEPPDP
jgi:hypothetical protein